MSSNENRVVSSWQVSDELLTYNHGSLLDIDAPLQQTWYDDDSRWERKVFFNQPSSGIDHMTTFNVSGLVAMSDSNLTIPDGLWRCN